MQETRVYFKIATLRTQAFKKIMTLILKSLLLDVNISFGHFHLFVVWINYKLTVL